MSEQEHDRVHEKVREGYARVATRGAGCCGGETKASAAATAVAVGYDPQDLAGPAAAGNLGLGCGNPTALARLEPGEVVLDLGSGAGFDAMLAAPKLGPTGRFIGVDMTPEMLERARTNAAKAGLARTVEFREGKIEELPVASQSVDVIISNCVINLSPDKTRVFREAFRVLRPGGRLAVSDIVLSEPLPPDVAALTEAWVACVGGALTEEDYLAAIRDAGFTDVRVEKRPAAPMLEGLVADPTIAAVVAGLDPERVRDVARTVFSASIEARRP